MLKFLIIKEDRHYMYWHDLEMKKRARCLTYSLNACQIIILIDQMLKEILLCFWPISRNVFQLIEFYFYHCRILQGSGDLCRALVKRGAILGTLNKSGVNIFNHQVATKQLLFRLLDLLSQEPRWGEGDCCEECQV